MYLVLNSLLIGKISQVIDMFPLHDLEGQVHLAESWVSRDKMTGFWSYSKVLCKDFFKNQPLDEIRDYVSPQSNARYR